MMFVKQLEGKYMDYNELWRVFKDNYRKYLIWLLANLGGLLIPYLVVTMTWLLFREIGESLPRNDMFWITATIVLATTMVSYQETKKDVPTQNLSLALYLIWVLLLMMVFGFFVAIGLKKPTIEDWQFWVITVLFLAFSLVWASIVWLHEQGLIEDREKMPSKPPSDPQLAAVTPDLPKIETGDQP
jgi:hypothetical protein